MKININIDRTPEHIWSSICGSAWETWSWWQYLNYDGGDWDKPCDLWILVTDPYMDEYSLEAYDVLSAKVTLPDLVRALEELSDHAQIMDCLINDDFDAVYGDVVMQQAIFGEIIYG